MLMLQGRGDKFGLCHAQAIAGQSIRHRCSFPVDALCAHRRSQPSLVVSFV
jgi:hypothetical protein